MKTFYFASESIVICPHCGSTDVRMFENQFINIVCQTCEAHFPIDLRQNVIPVDVCENILNLIDKTDDFYKPLTLSEKIGGLIREIVHFTEHHDPLCEKCKVVKKYFDSYQEACTKMYFDSAGAA